MTLNILSHKVSAQFFIVICSMSHLNTMHECDRQTDTPTIACTTFAWHPVVKTTKLVNMHRVYFAVADPGGGSSLGLVEPPPSGRIPMWWLKTLELVVSE